MLLRLSHDGPALQKDYVDLERVDLELAKYANNSQATISPEEDKRLKRLTDRRVLSIMIFTYFLPRRLVRETWPGRQEWRIFKQMPPSLLETPVTANGHLRYNKHTS